MLWNGAIVGALVASGVSLLSLVISKEAKISDFRQQWIDALREDLTILITAAIEAEGEMHSEDTKFVDAIAKANLVSTRIGLRLNNNESDSKDLLGKLAHLRNALHDIEVLKSTESFNVVQGRAQSAIEAGRNILKSEWTRVKQGEPTYSWTRRLVFSSFILLSLIFLCDLLRPDLLDRILAILRHTAGYRG